jgi:hypothetical protein
MRAGSARLWQVCPTPVVLTCQVSEGFYLGLRKVTYFRPRIYPDAASLDGRFPLAAKPFPTQSIQARQKRAALTNA